MARISTRSRTRRFAPLFLRLAPVIAAMSFLPALVSAAPAHVLLPVADVPLPGRATRFDYQSLDPLTGRLYIAHMGDGKLLVFDTHGRNVVASLPDFPVVTGVRVIPELHRVLASVTANHEVAIVDTGTLKVVERVADGDFPDGIAFAPAVGKAYVSDERGGHETVIDMKTNRRVATIDMGGEVGNTQYDAGSQRILANVQSRNQLVVIDPGVDAITARHPLPGDGPHGLEVVAPERLAFVACEGDGQLLVVNLDTWKTMQTFSSGHEPDVLAFDAGLSLLYVGTESNVVSVFRLQKGRLAKLEEVPVGPDAHSIAVDPATHEVFVPLRNVGGQPVLRIMKPALE